MGGFRLDMFRWVVTIIGALWMVCIPYRSLIEALYTLNSPPVVSFRFRGGRSLGRLPFYKHRTCAGFRFMSLGLRV